LLILMFGAIWSLFSQDPNTRTVAFSEFIRDVKQEKVAEVQIRPQDNSATYVYSLKGEGEDPQAKRRETVGVTGEATDALLAQHVAKVEYRPEDENGLLTSLLVTWLPMLVLLVIFFFFMRQLQASGGKAMSFGKSRARLLNESQNKVTFADVAGIDEAKDDCEEIIAFLKDPKKFQRLGGRIPKGVLLMG